MSMYQYKRSQRVAELLRSELSHILTQDMKDPSVKMASVTEVKLSDDLKWARVFISIIGDEEAKQDGLRGLERARNWIRNELGQRTDLRQVPNLDFRLDQTVDHAQNIERLLKRIKDPDADSPSD